MKIILCSLIIFSSCTALKVENKVRNTQKKEAKILSSKPRVFEVKKTEIFTGKVKYVDFETNLSDGAYTLVCIDNKNKKKLRYNSYVKNGIGNVYLGENYFGKKTTRSCSINDVIVLDLVVNEFNYKKERLNVSKRHIDISAKNLARHKKEKIVRAEVYKKSAKYFLFNEAFDIPLNSYITSHYGNQRIFNNKKRSQHLGNDMRAAVGVPIPVSNRGRVVFTGNWFFSGNLVVVDHGMNVFTNYMHLSKILVTKGSIINKGDIVGLAGKTGRVSGPHLHWGVKIHGHNVDGFSLVKESKKHFVTQ
jgi:murein DD-endopeptidase MepM/ murein hydrolase activator NlpD